jgi:hypothetical protein
MAAGAGSRGAPPATGMPPDAAPFTPEDLDGAIVRRQRR